jgi:thiol-disulfide isomerase/thioredoxin
MILEAYSYEVVTRLVWALGMIAGGLFLYRLANRAVLARARGNRLGLESVRPGTPVLLYFTTPSCAPCKTIQRPAIQQLKQQIGDQLQVVEIDASARPEVASQWGVLSVPTTFIIDNQGRPRHINHGVATADKLLKQVHEINS